MKLPEADFDVDAPDAFAVLAGVMTLHIGAEMAFARTPSVLWGITSLYVFGSALLLVGAGLTDVDVQKWGKPLSALAFTAVMVAVGMTYLMIRGSPIQTDALGFINEASSVLLAGQSPYGKELTLGKVWPTPTVSGGRIHTYSYPLGSALVVAPFRAVTSDGARLAVIGATAIAGALVIHHSPGYLAPLGHASMLVGGFASWGVQDLTDPLWVAPLLAAMVYWPWSSIGRDSLRNSAILFGIAMAMKQQPWFCAPFLMLWVWHERGRWAAGRYVAVVATVFGVIHLPTLAMGPMVTIQGLLTNLFGPGGTLVHLGVGVSALTLSGAYPIAKSAHTILMLIIGLSSVAAYWLAFDRVKWLAWIAWAPLLFFNYRSLTNYFVVVAPVAVMILASTRWRRPATMGGDDGATV
jgi:uncharacterized membrane protein